MWCIAFSGERCKILRSVKAILKLRTKLPWHGCVFSSSRSLYVVVTCTPGVHPLTEWTIPTFAFPAEAGTHLPTPEGWKAELARIIVHQTQQSWQHAGLWSRSRRLGLDTVSRRTNVSSRCRLKKNGQRLGLGNLRLVRAQDQCINSVLMGMHMAP